MKISVLQVPESMAKRPARDELKLTKAVEFYVPIRNRGIVAI